MMGIHFDGTVVLMEPNKSVYLTTHFLSRRCLSSSPEAKSAPCLFLASWNIVEAVFWVDLSGINKLFKTSGNSYALGYTSWAFSLHYLEPLCKGAHRSMLHGQVRFWSKSAAHRSSLNGFWKGSKLELLLGQTWACKCSNQIVLFPKAADMLKGSPGWKHRHSAININSTKYFQDHFLSKCFVNTDFQETRKASKCIWLSCRQRWAAQSMAQISSEKNLK